MIEPVVFLVDVDNTLLDNGTVVEALRRELIGAVGPEREARYWDLFEQLWKEEGFADYLGALQRLRIENPRDQSLARVSRFLIEYPFAERLYPGALEALAALGRRGRVVIVSDGDIVQQPNKIERSGLAAAVGGRVLVYIHKEEMLDDIEQRYPARHYVLVDDKLRILAAVKASWGERVTTVFVRQGHYARDPAVLAAYPPADVTIESIADAASLAPDGLRESAT